MAAAWAAVMEGGYFSVEGPEFDRVLVSLGKDARCFRGSITLPGRKRPIRHLVAVSAELAQTAGESSVNRTILCDKDPVFVFRRLAQRFGLPVVPEWRDWFMHELKRRNAVSPLLGLGCAPVVVVGTKRIFLNWIGRALRRGAIGFPERNGPISWPERGWSLQAATTPGLEYPSGLTVRVRAPTMANPFWQTSGIACRSDQFGRALCRIATVCSSEPPLDTI